VIAGTKSKTDRSMGVFALGTPLAPRWLFARRLAINMGIAVALILISLAIGMICYHRLEGLDWLRSFGHSAMILGGMGPYEEPKNDGGKLFEGLYALYSGLLLVVVTGLILTPILLRVMHHFHLPDADSEKGAPPRRSKRPSGAQQ
jgi:hypothetical protein